MRPGQPETPAANGWGHQTLDTSAAPGCNEHTNCRANDDWRQATPRDLLARVCVSRISSPTKTLPADLQHAIGVAWVAYAGVRA
jgi:hypothetical protein